MGLISQGDGNNGDIWYSNIVVSWKRFIAHIWAALDIDLVREKLLVHLLWALKTRLGRPISSD